MLKKPYANPRVASLSLDQSKQLHSRKGKITPAVLCLWCQIHFLVKFWKCQKAKALLELFCFLSIWGKSTAGTILLFHQSYLAKSKTASVVLLPHEAK